MGDTKWIWRCHIDLTDANPEVWEFFRPFVELHDASVWTMPEFVPASLEMDRVVHAPPCIDPLSVKNLDLAMPFCQELTRQYGVDVHRPIVCQVSRFDPWKDPVGVIEAFRHRARACARRAARARGLDGDRRPRGLPRVGRDRGRARRRPRHPPAVEPPPGRVGADQRVPARRRRRSCRSRCARASASP